MKLQNKKTIWLLAISVIIVISAIWIRTRWGVWFSNLPEPAYESPKHPSRIVMTCRGESNTSRMFSWVYGNTNEAGEVEIVKTDGSDTLRITAAATRFRSRSGEASYYKAAVENLEPSSVYTYRIIHPSDTTRWFTFRTAAPEEKLSFIFIGDIQDTPDGTSGKLFHEIDSLHPGMTLYVLGGDVIERPMNAYWDYWYSTMEEIATNTPIIAAAGNHEYLKGFPPELEERFYYTFPIFDRENSGDNACAHITAGNAEFFIIDSNKEFWTYPSQRRWLKREMARSEAKWKIVVLHHPIYSMRGSFNNILQRMAFNPVIKECGATLVLQGHEHAYMRKAAISDAGNYTSPVYITSHCSPKNYRIGFSGGAQRYGGGDRYYQLVTVSADTMNIETYNSSHQLYDKLIITDSCGIKKVEELPVPLPETITVTPDIAAKPKKAEAYQHDIDKYLSSKRSSSE